MPKKLIIIAHDIRSCHNVGSLLRTADGLGVHKVYLTGFTPYPLRSGDRRLPHLAAKQHKQIAKTALDAESSVIWEQNEDVIEVINELRNDGYEMVGLEQVEGGLLLPDWNPGKKVALLLGNELFGIEPGLYELMDYFVEIPMKGHKESFNVVEATSMAMYQALCISK
jgi:23S rRNA (guanosine2251-2'-O)-methyltransferase